MNYQFTRACYSFFVDLDATTHTLTQGHSYGAIEPYDARQFAQRLEALLAWYPSEIASAQLNLLGSHDTARFLTIARGDTSALKLAYLTMMTYPGAPMLYYGDEIGLEGAVTPTAAMPAVGSSPMASRPARGRATVHRSAETLRRRVAGRRLRAPVCPGQGLCLCAPVRLAHGPGRLNAGTRDVTLDLEVQRLFPHEGHVRAEWSNQQYTVTDGSVRGLRIPAREGYVWVGEQPP